VADELAETCDERGDSHRFPSYPGGCVPNGGRGLRPPRPQSLASAALGRVLPVHPYWRPSMVELDNIDPVRCHQEMTTRVPSEVTMMPERPGISAADAHQAARISYHRRGIGS